MSCSNGSIHVFVIPATTSTRTRTNKKYFSFVCFSFFCSFFVPLFSLCSSPYLWFLCFFSPLIRFFFVLYRCFSFPFSLPSSLTTFLSFFFCFPLVSVHLPGQYLRSVHDSVFGRLSGCSITGRVARSSAFCGKFPLYLCFYFRFTVNKNFLNKLLKRSFCVSVLRKDQNRLSKMKSRNSLC